MHVIIVVSLFWIIPFFNNAINVGKSWAESNNNATGGIITDVCEIEKEGLKYRGYKILYNEKDLYVMGTGVEDCKTGDYVKVLINQHPYGPLKTLLVTIQK